MGATWQEVCDLRFTNSQNPTSDNLTPLSLPISNVCKFGQTSGSIRQYPFVYGY